MTQYRDLLISDRDITLDTAGLSVQIDDRAVIGQDLKHAILDSGLLVELLAERSPHKWALNINRLTLLAEDDTRIIPGTVVVERNQTHTGQLFIFADTQMGAIAYQVQLSDDQIAEMEAL